MCPKRNCVPVKNHESTFRCMSACDCWNPFETSTSCPYVEIVSVRIQYEHLWPTDKESVGQVTWKCGEQRGEVAGKVPSRAYLRCAERDGGRHDVRNATICWINKSDVDRLGECTDQIVPNAQLGIGIRKSEQFVRLDRDTRDL